MMFTVKNGEIVFDPDSTDQLLDAAIVSLFSRQRVKSDEVREHHTDLGGYWGDLIDNTSLGSKLWLQDREVQSVEILEDAKEYALDCLQWMKDQNLVSNIDVSGSYQGEKIMLTIFLDNKELNLRV